MLDREVHMGKDLLFHFKAHGRHPRQPFRWPDAPWCTRPK